MGFCDSMLGETNMIKVEIVEAFGPMCGHGGWYQITGTATHARSFKKAVELAKRNFRLNVRRCDKPAGVPVYYSATITRNGVEVFYSDRDI